MFITVYPDSDAKWRWGLHTVDGREIVRSPLGHRRKSDCVDDAQSFRQSVAVAPIIDQEHNPDLARRGARITQDR